MSWLVNVYAEVTNGKVAKDLLGQTCKVTDIESVGGTQLRISVNVDDSDASDADSACEFAKAEVVKRLNLLSSMGDAAATQLET